MDTPAGKAMVGEMLDASVAQLKTPATQMKGTEKPRRNQPKKDKHVDSPQEKAAKDVAKDIKM